MAAPVTIRRHPPRIPAAIQVVVRVDPVKATHSSGSRQGDATPHKNTRRPMGEANTQGTRHHSLGGCGGVAARYVYERRPGRRRTDETYRSRGRRVVGANQPGRGLRQILAYELEQAPNRYISAPENGDIVWKRWYHGAAQFDRTEEHEVGDKRPSRAER